MPVSARERHLISKLPVFINCRDRVSDLRALVQWLEAAGHERITMLDNQSTYGPLLAYYEETPHEVVYLDANLGHTALWAAGLVPDEPFVYTDPDVIPVPECPPDAAEIMWDILQLGNWPKCGMGLDIAALDPGHSVYAWESTMWRDQILSEPCPVYIAPTDTTWAVYRPGTEFHLEGVRTGYPYVAIHTTWWMENMRLDPEHEYYLAHANAEHSSWLQRHE